MAFVNGGRIVTDKLVLSLDASDKNSFVSGSTMWYDLSGGNISGSLNAGTTYNPDNNGSILFTPASSGYIAFGNKTLNLDLVDKSFCAWVYLGSSLNNPTSIIDKDFDTSPGVYGGWGFWVGSNRKLWFWNSSNQDFLDNGSSTIGTNVWTYIAMTYDSTNKITTFYINGSVNSTITNINAAEKSSGTQQLSIGAARTPSLSIGYVNGRIANVLAYNKVLSSAEILQNYTQLKSRFNL